jgi:hypothetical protein
MEIDPRFQGAASRSKARRLRRRLRLGGLGAMAVAVLSLAGWALWPGGEGDLQVADGGDGMIQLDLGDAGPAAPRLDTPFVDIAGDPMILRFGAASATKTRPVPGPAALDAVRVGPVTPDRLTLVTDDLIVASRELMTALPSSREDFAFFQAQRSAALQPEAARPEPALLPDGEAPTGVEVTVAADDSSWGVSLTGAETVTYVETAVENTTSIAFVRPEAQRRAVFDDAVVAVDVSKTLAEVLETRGLAPAEADPVIAAAEAILPGSTALIPGSVVALRLRPLDTATGEEVLHLSLYGPDGYILSVARTGSRAYGQGPDLWIDQDLRRLARGDGVQPLAAGQEYRLLDGFYSAAIRNGVPSGLVGEAIVLMSQAHDMDAIADPADKLTLLYAPLAQPGRAGPAQILYAAIDGPSGRRDCYVVPSDDAAGYACFRGQGGGVPGGGGAGQLGGGLIQPAQGIMTSGFGPRFHPILKVPKLHEGIDWAAPTGTPVVAAGAGTIARANVSDSYGNIVYIDHGGGMESRYAHLDAFAPGIAVGVTVTQGQLIGYIGTTGRSTGPHLHFEVRIGGAPVDPMNVPRGGGGAVVAVAAVSGPASGAVEELTNQIIKVESGGNANAKNPLSSATGLGQFIESTWLRMMRDYRPDLAANMDRASLLALRTDPTLSREMVMNLARENEAYLRGKGHAITAGRLYLAHFAGPGGADQVLSAPDTAMIRDVMGAGVVSANPFLANYTVADLKAWADRKMGSHSGVAAAAPPPPVVIPPEVKVYMDLVDAMVAEATAADPEEANPDGTAPETPPDPNATPPPGTTDL